MNGLGGQIFDQQFEISRNPQLVYQKIIPESNSVPIFTKEMKKFKEVKPYSPSFK